MKQYLLTDLRTGKVYKLENPFGYCFDKGDFEFRALRLAQKIWNPFDPLFFAQFIHTLSKRVKTRLYKLQTEDGSMFVKLVGIECGPHSNHSLVCSNVDNFDVLMNHKDFLKKVNRKK